MKRRWADSENRKWEKKARKVIKKRYKKGSEGIEKGKWEKSEIRNWGKKMRKEREQKLRRKV